MFNLFDLFIVLVGCLDVYIFPMVGMSASKLAFFRVVRLARLTRTLKVVRVLKNFSKVRVLIGTVASSFSALFFSMLFLFILMFLAACFVSQMLQSHLEDTHLDLDTQRRLWERFGTSTRSFWSMFEVTLGSQGTSPTQKLVEVHWGFCLFFLLYVSGVVFAVICVIQALFLKDTLEVAANDADAMVQEGLQHRSETIHKLEQVFLAADTSCDGVLSRQEFEDLMSIPQVQGFLALLDLDIGEATTLFNVLNDGDSYLDYGEFVQGVMKLKGQARAMDVITMDRDIKRALVYLESMDARLPGSRANSC